MKEGRVPVPEPPRVSLAQAFKFVYNLGKRRPDIFLGFDPEKEPVVRMNGIDALPRVILVNDPSTIVALEGGKPVPNVTDRFDKVSVANRIFRTVFGENSFTATNENAKGRSSVMRNLSSSGLEAFGPDIQRIVMEEVEEKASSEKSFDIRELNTDIAFKTACTMIFGFDPKEHAEYRERAECFRENTTRQEEIALELSSIPNKRLLKWRQAQLTGEIEMLQKNTRGFVRELMKDPRIREGSMLSVIAKSELPQDQKEAEAAILLFAAFQSTASSMDSMLWQMAKNPDKFERVRENLGKDGIGSRPVQDEIKRIVDESSRLTTVIPAAVRGVIDSVEFDGLLYQKGTTVIFNHAAAGRDKRMWGNDANQFEPDRMLRDGIKASNILAFGVGPRSCSGRGLAGFVMKHYMNALLANGITVELDKKSPVIINEKTGFPHREMGFIARARDPINATIGQHPGFPSPSKGLGTASEGHSVSSAEHSASGSGCPFSRLFS